MLARLDDKEAQATLTELKAREGFSRREVERQSELIARQRPHRKAHERALSELRSIQALITAQNERLQNYKLVAPHGRGRFWREDARGREIVDSLNVLYPHGLRGRCKWSPR